MPRPGAFQVLALAILFTLTTLSCGGNSKDSASVASASPSPGPLWAAGNASATLIVEGRDAAAFEDGTCERALISTDLNSFRLEAGTPGTGGEGILVAVVLKLGPSASFTGDGSGRGAQVDHAGTHWRLSGGPNALVFDDDLLGGTIRLSREDDGDGGPIDATVRFRC